MRVRYTFPVRGKLQPSETGLIERENWSFQFLSNSETGFVETLVVEISDIPQERWPTLTAVEQDPNADIPRFPFEVNRNVFSFHEFSSELINLESYLSLFGLEEIGFDEIKQEWLPDENDEDVGIQAGFSRSSGETGLHLEKPTDWTLHVCAAAAAKPNTSELETAALAHFRVGQGNMLRRRYIEAIRHLYLSIECLFANGKHQEKATITEFQKSQLLVDTITNLFLNTAEPHLSFNRIRHKYHTLEGDLEPSDVLKFLFRLRGDLQHASASSIKRWHPSKQGDFEHEAICLTNICEDVLFNLFDARERLLVEEARRKLESDSEATQVPS